MSNNRILLFIVIAGVMLLLVSHLHFDWTGSDAIGDELKCDCRSKPLNKHSDKETPLYFDTVGNKMTKDSQRKISNNKLETDVKFMTNPEAKVQEQKKRLALLNVTCAKLQKKYKGTLLEKKVRAHYLYDRKSKILFCDLPKIGSTFLKQVLHIVVGHRKDSDPFKITGDEAHGIPFNDFNKLEFTDMLPILQDSYKFLFVRNPYSRILSGYIDKIFTNNYIFWKSTGRRIIKEFRDKPDEVSINCGHNVIFEEFIKHIINSEKNNVHRNAHWYPVYDSCRPCSMRYDFIGKIENYQEDMQQLLKSLKKEDKVDITKMDKGNDWEAVTLTVKRVYEVVKKVPDCVSLPQALERAWKVLQMRSVISYHVDFPYDVIKSNENISQQKFLDLIKTTMEKHPLDKATKTKIRQEILFKAYSSLSKESLNTFREIFLPDFLYFGYSKDMPQSVLGKDAKNWRPFSFKL